MRKQETQGAGSQLAEGKSSETPLQSSVRSLWTSKRDHPGTLRGEGDVGAAGGSEREAEGRRTPGLGSSECPAAGTAPGGVSVNAFRPLGLPPFAPSTQDEILGSGLRKVRVTCPLPAWVTIRHIRGQEILQKLRGCQVWGIDGLTLVLAPRSITPTLLEKKWAHPYRPRVLSANGQHAPVVTSRSLTLC